VTKYEGESVPVTSPILEEGSSERAVIGSMAQMTEDDALAVLKEAETAWSKGQGEWPQMSAAQRISALEKAVGMIRLRRDEIVTALVWEICKSVDDARAEFDRTMAFIEATIETFRAADALHSTTRAVNGILVRIRRAAIGIMVSSTHCMFVPLICLHKILHAYSKSNAH
jgi:glyceraldehyde-3-phosphate dehydrogenase (NADP+)